MTNQLRHFVAVVDDERLMREAIENLLRSAGHRAEGFASAEDFLHSSRFAAISCMVLDLQLPGMSGLDLLRRMCELSPRTPVVIVSATDGHWREQALHAGALAFFRKPVLDAELLDAVRKGIATQHVQVNGGGYHTNG